MNVLSLFDGISCGRLALERAKVPIDWYYASETNRHFISISSRHYPNSVNLGDVDRINLKLLPQIDLITGDIVVRHIPLFFEFYYILEKLRELNPNIKFLFSISQPVSDGIKLITRYLKVEPVVISTNLAYNSLVNVYWANWTIHKPQIDAVHIADICEENVAKKYYLNGQENVFNNIVEVRPCDDVSFLTKGHMLLGSDGSLRAFTPLEYERLRKMPDGYTEGIPDKYRYMAVGGGWDIDILANIFSQMPTGDK